MRIGFTGTKKGMTHEQQLVVTFLLTWLGEPPLEFHHGDCVGADAQAATAAHSLGLRIVQHPPSSDSRRAFTPADEVRDPAPYLVRNHNIVKSVDVMIATPKESVEVLRSGTWSTIRFARKYDTRTLIVHPTGRMKVY